MPATPQKRCKDTLTKLVIFSAEEFERRRYFLKSQMLPIVGANLENLTDDVIDILVDKYDDLLFNGALKRQLLKLGWKMNNRAHFNDSELKEEHESAAFLCFQQRSREPSDIGLIFNRKALANLGHGTKCAFKKQCVSAFECFTDIFEHELIHLAQFLFCGYSRKSGRHDKVFMSMARKWFAHKSATHSLW